MDVVATFSTPETYGYAVKWSPYLPDRLVCAACQRYGLEGPGELLVLDVPNDGSGQMVLAARMEYPDGLFDVTWSENDPEVLVAGGGDGTVQLWKIGTPKPKCLRGHTKEVYGVDWSQTRTQPMVLSASWDTTVRLWDPAKELCVSKFVGHQQLVYSATWSPHMANIFGSVSGDTTLRLWSTQSPPAAPPISVAVHDSEVLCCDWSKYEQHHIVTGCTNGLALVWDLRKLQKPAHVLSGHQYAVRRIKFSPHRASCLISVSYDFTTRTWDLQAPVYALEEMQHHSEFVYGLDLNLHREGVLADCAWDQTVRVVQPRSLAPLAPVPQAL